MIVNQKGEFLTGRYSKYENLLKFLNKLSSEEFTGEVKINYHKGNFSKRLSVKVTKEI